MIQNDILERFSTQAPVTLRNTLDDECLNTNDGSAVLLNCYVEVFILGYDPGICNLKIFIYLCVYSITEGY